MNIHRSALSIGAALLALCAPASSFAVPAAEDPALGKLIEKGAALRSYHYRIQWEGEGTSTQTDQMWYGGPGRARQATSYGHGMPGHEYLICEGSTYLVNPYQYDVTKVGEADGSAMAFSRMIGDIPLYLTRGYLRGWEVAQVDGTEAVGGRRCQVVDLWPAGRARWRGRWVEEGGFVAYLPEAVEPWIRRLWVDVDSGLVRRWGVSGGRGIGAEDEIVQTQVVNGIAFPLVIKRSGYGYEQTGRVVEASVNEVIPEEATEFRPPPNWLVFDQTLSVEEARAQVKAHPDDPNLHYTLGKLLPPFGDREQERAAEFRRAAELAPDSPSPLAALLESTRFGHGGGGEDMVEAARRLVEKAGDRSGFARMMLAGALEQANRLEEAIAEYRAMIEEGRPEFAHLLAHALARSGDFEGAYRAATSRPFAEVAAFAGSGAGGLVEWAAKSDHLDDLRASAEQAVAESPRLASRRLLLARVLQAQGHEEEALEQLRAVAIEEPASHWALNSVVLLAEVLGDEQLADRARRAAVTGPLRAGRGWAMMSLAQEGGDRQAVLDDIVREAAAMWTEASDARARASVAETVREMAGRWDLPRGEGRKAAAVDPRRISAAECAVRGILEAEQAGASFGDYHQKLRRHASACLQRALATWPNEATLWATLGEMRWRAKAWRTAADAYGEAAAADPDHVNHAARAAFALAWSRQHDRALAMGGEVVARCDDDRLGKLFFASLQMSTGYSRAARETLLALYASPEEEPGGDRQTVVGLLARCHERLGQIAEAEAVLKGEMEVATDYRQRENAYRKLVGFLARHKLSKKGYAAAKAFFARGGEGPLAKDALSAIQGQLYHHDVRALAAVAQADLIAHRGDADTVRFARVVYERTGRPAKLLPMLKVGAKNAARKVEREAADSPAAWREAAELYLLGDAWEGALAAVQRLLELTPESEEAARMSAQFLAARAYAGAGQYHQATRRLIPIMGRAQEPAVLREAADALVEVYLLQGEHEKALATLADLRLRTKDRSLLDWIERRSKELVGEEQPPTPPPIVLPAPVF